MTKAFARFVPPPPEPAPQCMGCFGMAPDVLVPGEAAGTDGMLELCWICAHLVTEHEVTIDGKGLGSHKMCKCKREEIFPDRTFAPMPVDDPPPLREQPADSWTDVATAYESEPNPLALSERAVHARSLASSLTADRVREIRRRAAAGERQTKLATEFGVSNSAINRIVMRTRWADVQ